MRTLIVVAASSAVVGAVTALYLYRRWARNAKFVEEEEEKAEEEVKSFVPPLV